MSDLGIIEEPLLLFGGPYSNLAATVAMRHRADELGALLLELNSEGGVTLITVTHSRRLASLMQRQITLRSGRIEEDATA